jgi:hypothetical protein
VLEDVLYRVMNALGVGLDEHSLSATAKEFYIAKRDQEKKWGKQINLN